MRMDADVIIAGAGPAGSIAAYQLAHKGFHVMVLEKAQFPRYKVCGAGLTHKIITEIPFDITPVVENTIFSFTFSSGLKEKFTRRSELPLIYCTMRDSLDEFLIRKAMEAGAGVQFGTRVDSVMDHGEYVEVKTRSGVLRSRLVIGAEGASGAVARSVGLWDDIIHGIAWEAEVDVDQGSLERLSDTVFLDWGTMPGGYGWLFPKSTHFSLGVGGPPVLSGRMMEYYNLFLDFLRRDGIRIEGTRSMKSWPIPGRHRLGDFHKGRIVVAGDAAGLTDPLTGEGIYYAVMSGKIAARHCAGYLESGSGSLKGYSDEVNSRLMPELLEADRIRYLFDAAPLRIHHFVQNSDRAWRAFGKVLRGERNYADVRKGFGKWRFLWTLTCRVARLISLKREKKIRKEGF